MKQLISVVAITVAALCGSAHAADKTPTAQQNKMVTCNKEAGDKKGDERKDFMKTCLSNKPAEPMKPVTQQDKMKSCNASATGKTGDDRKAYMKTCLSGKAA
ncbi:PsiF family protein [soil metagenome]